MPTKEQLAVPASNAEQLDPPEADLRTMDIGDDELLSHPATRGQVRGKDLKVVLEKGRKADEASLEPSAKAVAKQIGKDDDLSVTSSGETVPKEVQDLDEDQRKLQEERAKEVAPKTPPKGQPITGKGDQGGSKSEVR